MYRQHDNNNDLEEIPYDPEILGLLMHLDRISTSIHAAWKVARGQNLMSSEVDTLSRAIRCAPATAWQERAVAAATLCRLSLDVGTRESLTEPLLNMLRTGFWPGKRPVVPWLLALAVDLIVYGFIIPLSVLILPLFIFLFSRSVKTNPETDEMPLLTRIRRSLNRRERLTKLAAIYGIAALKSPEALEPVCIAMRNEDPATRHAASLTLWRLLRAVTENDYGRVSVGAVQELCDLTGTEDTALDLLILQALGRAGGGSALRRVQYLAEHAHRRQVRIAAKDALPTLEARAQQEMQAVRLLRAATAPYETDRLLRPAASTTTPPDELLRPVNSREVRSIEPEGADHRGA